MENVVTHISTVHTRYDTRIFHKECSSLSAKGYGVTLIVADGRGNEVRNGIKIVDLGLAPGGRLGRILIGFWRVVTFVLGRKIRFVHLHDPELLIAGFVFKAFGIQVIYDMHENVPKQILNKTWLHTWARKPLSILASGIERLLLRNVPVVMAEESYSMDYRWLTKTEVIQNFPILEYFEVGASKKFEVFTIGYIGGVTQERGILTVLSAIASLRRSGRKINFECLGPVSSEVAASPLFISACEEGWLHAPGRVDGASGWQTIARCHVGVAVLSPLPNYVGSWPTKMFEYMAMGLPVVVSDFPLYRSVVAQSACGMLVDPNNVQDIVDALARLMDQADEADAMGNRGRLAVNENFVWSHEAKKLFAFYESVSPML